jgi:hypothetical protein
MAWCSRVIVGAPAYAAGSARQAHWSALPFARRIRCSRRSRRTWAITAGARPRVAVIAQAARSWGRAGPQ